MIITIARECGTNGHEIGEWLAKKAGIALYDKEALKQEAQKQNKYEKMRRFFEEQPVNSLLYAIAMESSIEEIEENAFHFMRELASKRDMVVIGRCSNYLLRGYEDVTTVFIHGDLPDKIKRVMAIKNIATESKAEEYMNLIDNNRINFHKSLTKERWGDARNYDLALNGSHATAEELAEYILKYRELKLRENK